MTTATKTKQIPLIICTLHKGVFYGWGDPKSIVDKTIRIEKAQMCISWTSDIRGVTGLANVGPSKSCRVGLPVPAMTLYDVTAIFECAPEAIATWEKAPWNG